MYRSAADEQRCGLMNYNLGVARHRYFHKPDWCENNNYMAGEATKNDWSLGD